MRAEDRDVWQDILARHNGDEEQAAETYIKYKCLTDLHFLGTEIFGLKEAKEGKRNRYDPKFHGWLAGKMGVSKDTLVLVPRGHMKSSWAKIRVVQLVLQNPMIRVGLFSRTAGLVEEQLADIRNLLMNPLLRRYFPDQIPDPGKRFSGWQRATANELTLVRRAEWGRIPQENQVEAWGLGATVTGRHYDVIVLDDPINEQSCSTPEQIQKARDYFAYLQAILEPDGFMLVIGTRYHHADLYGTIIKNRWFGRRVFIREAIENGRPIYSFFTLKMLNKIKTRVGPFIWSCQYMNNPIPQEFQIFPPPQPTYGRLPADEYEYYITMDPAATAEVYSDDTAIIVCAVNRHGQLYVVEAVRMHEPGNITAAKLVELMVRYRPRRVGIEFQLQEHLRYIIGTKIDEWERGTKQTLGIPIHPIKVPRNMSKGDRINRTLGSFVREGKLFVQEHMEDLQLQMEYFPRGEHDDLVDALAMQMQLVDDFRSGYWEEPLDTEITRKTFWDLFGAPGSDREPRSWEEQFIA